jgi:amino acid transporter
MATVPASTAGVTADRNLRKEVKFIGLIWASVGSIIGSGWLYASFDGAQIAGTAVILSWIIGLIALMILAFVHAELGGMFPQAGGTARYPHYTFGSVTGASFGWFSWLQAAAVAPVEVLAVMGYAEIHISWLAKLDAAGNYVPTWPQGYLISAALLALFVGINFFGVRWLANTNSAAVWWKIFVPVLAIIALCAHNWHSSNFGAHGGFAPYGLHGIFAATAAGAVIFALLGFEQAIQFGGESANPQKDLPRAVVGAMLIGGVIYVLVQVAFIAALPHSSLAHGWAKLSFSADAGPIAGVATLGGLGWLATILYIDAFISPAATGLIYTSSTSRISYGLSKNGYVPPQFELTDKRGVPWFSLFAAFVAALIFFLPFPSWQNLIELIVAASVLMYAGAPLAFGVFRLHHEHLPRAYRLPAGGFWSPVAFFVANMLIFWTPWDTIWKLGIAILIGYVIIGLNFVFKLNPRTPKPDWRSAQWLPVYLLGMGVISWQGSFGGQDHLKLGPDFAVIFVFSMIIYYWARAVALKPEETQAYIEAGATEVVPEILQDVPLH